MKIAIALFLLSGTMMGQTSKAVDKPADKPYTSFAIQPFDAENSWILEATFTGKDICKNFVRKDGFAHSLIDGREYIQTCIDGKLGIMIPKPAAPPVAHPCPPSECSSLITGVGGASPGDALQDRSKKSTAGTQQKSVQHRPQ
jgi:hypothetical protein